MLYLFLLWVARSSLRDLRRPDESARSSFRRPRPARTAPPRRAPAPPAVEPRLVVERAPGHAPGMEYEIGDGAVLGRGDQAEIRLEDPFASGRHARSCGRAGSSCSRTSARPTARTSTRSSLTGPQPLHRGDRVRIGDSEFTYVDR